MILALDCSTPTCHMWLLAGDKTTNHAAWLAERRLAKELLGQLEQFLESAQTDFQALQGLLVFRGPGSFTGLRVGASVMNALAMSLQIPIVGETGQDWRQAALQRLRSGANDKVILPEYGGSAHITSPKK